MITRRSSPLPVAVVVALGGVLLAAALNPGAAARATPLLPTPAVILTVGDRSKPSELIHLLRDLASYDPLTAARYVAQADAAYRRGTPPSSGSLCRAARRRTPSLRLSPELAQPRPSRRLLLGPDQNRCAGPHRRPPHSPAQLRASRSTAVATEDSPAWPPLEVQERFVHCGYEASVPGVLDSIPPTLLPRLIPIAPDDDVAVLVVRDPGEGLREDRRSVSVMVFPDQAHAAGPLRRGHTLPRSRLVFKRRPATRIPWPPPSD